MTQIYNYGSLFANREQRTSIVQYVGRRKISLQLANLYLKEVIYQTKGKQYFAVGFQNDLGGYKLRNGLDFKGGKTANTITTFELGTDSAVLFEGFFDFLSALEHYGSLKPTKTTIVLNTCNNLNQTFPLLTNRKRIHCYLGNAETGHRTLEKLKNKSLSVKDWSAFLYPERKDFNDYLVVYRNKASITLE